MTMTWGPVPDDRKPAIDGAIARVPLTQGQVAIIDAADAELIGQHRWTARWAKSGRCYYAITGHGTRIPMHRLIAEPSAGTDVDHANHDTLDNRRANLRPATRLDNNRNRRTVRPENISGYIGVGYHAQTGRWRARVSVGRERTSLGLFRTAEEAAVARDAWIRANHPSEFWTFNFPMPDERGIHRERTTA